MYAVTLPLGRSFITACIGAGFGGVAASLFKLGTVSQGGFWLVRLTHHATGATTSLPACNADRLHRRIHLHLVLWC